MSTRPEEPTRRPSTSACTGNPLTGRFLPPRAAVPSISPVSGTGEKIRRHYSLAISSAGAPSVLGSFAVRRFLPHLRGLEGFSGREVLEIGGTDDISMEGFFRATGARYLNVRLEDNPSGNPNVRVGDFMDVSGKYDLVISLGVFEPGALDIDFARMKDVGGLDRLDKRAEQLAALTKGHCVIGTAGAPCVFGPRLLEKCGFTAVLRESPFYSFMNGQGGTAYAPDDRSELIVLRKS
ncbi:MAG: hypothetical protein AB1324_06090 [Candidatus Micrarchaeota archaeon]